MKVEEKARLVLGEIELSRVGKDYAGIVESARQVVDYHAVEHTGLGIFTLYIEVHIRYLVVK